MALSVLTLNLARPTSERARPLLEYLWHRDEDVLVLTEVAATGGSALVAQVCRAAGYSVVGPYGPGLGVLVVGRGVAVEEDQSTPSPADLDGRITVVTVGGKVDGVRLVGVYGAASDPVRYSSAAQRERKRRWLSAFVPWATTYAARPGLLVGDLNVVDPDDVRRDPRLRYVLAEEAPAYRQLTTVFGDAYRLINPDGADVTWLDHTGVGCRYDHALVSGLPVTACAVDRRPLDEGLTDHAALSLTIG